MAESTKTPARKKPSDRKPKADAPIEIKSTRTELPVKLIGKAYKVRPPKALVMLDFAKNLQEAQASADQDPSAILEHLTNWIRSSFSEAEGEDIINRLHDPKDDLDLSHIMDLMNAVMERTTGNPTM